MTSCGVLAINYNSSFNNGNFIGNQPRIIIMEYVAVSNSPLLIGPS